jgi:hypothetical protein
MAAEFYNPTADRNQGAQTIAFAKLMAGIAGALVSGDGNDTSAINSAAMLGGNAAENNWLGDHQKAAMAKEMREAQSTLEKIKVAGKYLAISGKQDILTGTGIGIGLAEAGWSDVQGLAEFLSDPVAGLTGLKQLIGSPEMRQALGDQLFSSLDQKIASMQSALVTGGDDAAIQLGKDLGSIIWQVGGVATGIVGATKGTTALAQVGVKIAASSLEKVASQLMKLDAGAIKGFKSADELNNLMSAYNKVPAWKAGTQIAETTLRPGTRVQMVVDKVAYDALTKRGDMNFVGNWATFDDVTSQAFARDNLAITSEFKKDVGYVVELEIVKPVNAQIGVVGSQGVATGGANQLNFLFEQRNGGEFFKVTGQKVLP